MKYGEVLVCGVCGCSFKCRAPFMLDLCARCEHAMLLDAMPEDESQVWACERAAQDVLRDVRPGCWREVV